MFFIGFSLQPLKNLYEPFFYWVSFETIESLLLAAKKGDQNFERSLFQFFNDNTNIIRIIFVFSSLS